MAIQRIGFMRQLDTKSNAVVIGPDGKAMTLHDLPPPETTRWVIRRKAQVVYGVRAGLISLEAACARYNLTREEFASWERLIERHGIRGLRVTRLKEYRESSKTQREAS